MEIYRRKVTNSILQAIMDVEAKTRTEQISKMDYLINFNKIMEDYDTVLNVLMSQSTGNFKLKKSTYQPSEFDSQVFDNIIKSIYETTPQKGDRGEIIEQAEYVLNLNRIMLDYPNVIKTLIQWQNKESKGDIDF
ncbi:MAG: hypothetical protein J6D03_01565 [Clostridia bacterium]|nr:hypothetical protein [Clostridia bacterium]